MMGVGALVARREKHRNMKLVAVLGARTDHPDLLAGAFLPWGRSGSKERSADALARRSALFNFCPSGAEP